VPTRCHIRATDDPEEATEAAAPPPAVVSAAAAEEAAAGGDHPTAGALRRPVPGARDGGQGDAILAPEAKPQIGVTSTAGHRGSKG